MVIESCSTGLLGVTYSIHVSCVPQMKRYSPFGLMLQGNPLVTKTNTFLLLNEVSLKLIQIL